MLDVHPTPREDAVSVSASVNRLQPGHAGETIRLLQELRVSMYGIASARVHRALVEDAISGRIDCRVAIRANRLQGVVMAAPRSYWRALLARDWPLLIACARARVTSRAAAVLRGSHGAEAASPPGGTEYSPIRPGDPPITWTAPGAAWRVIFVGSAPSARGQGIGAALYRSLMADRSLVARVARDNAPSLALHRSVGWRLYADTHSVLAVHLRDEPVTPRADSPCVPSATAGPC